MNFNESERIDVTKHMERKGQFSYLSWPFAVSELRKNYPSAKWIISHFGENNQPYCVSDAGCFVEVTVWIDDLPFTQVHPVLDNRNNTVKTPNAFQINTSIQRCLVKAIALATGIGLHIYAGEDLPPDDDQTSAKQDKLDRAENYNQMAAEVDKCTNETAMAKWFKDNANRIKGLSETDQERMRLLYKQYSDVFKKEKG